ncbi:MAG: RNA polymerase sigma factor [Gemmatimonadota bacterium]
MEKTERTQEEALGQLLDGLTIVALRALGDHDQAQDAAQEAVLRVLAVVRTKGIPQGYSLESYAYGTLKHVIADTHRRKKRLVALPRWLTANDESPLEALVDRERVVAIATALRGLDAANRALLERCYLRGEKVVDIARETGEPADSESSAITIVSSRT